ncbi:MmcQ/YjbR family DNA-binding protein [Deinococcus sp.]|uniref:MmcQ/YjbR family DNA-binding protein n=1 Tax=Deinococcus sp. TaxID=47478 RepID=UPI003C7A09AA
MQTVTALREACQKLPGSAETFPFGLETLVLKVGGKLYALIGLKDDPLTLSLKCDPVRAEALRRAHVQIVPGYHLSKKHWNTLTLDGALPGALVAELLAHSYDLVLGSLTRAQRAEVNGG